MGRACHFELPDCMGRNQSAVSSLRLPGKAVSDKTVQECNNIWGFSTLHLYRAVAPGSDRDLHHIVVLTVDSIDEIDDSDGDVATECLQLEYMYKVGMRHQRSF